jgi:hypothetical protein
MTTPLGHGVHGGGSLTIAGQPLTANGASDVFLMRLSH